MKYHELVRMVVRDNHPQSPLADLLEGISTKTLEAIRSHSHRRYVVGPNVVVRVRALEAEALWLETHHPGPMSLDGSSLLHAASVAFHVASWRDGGVDELRPSGPWE